MNPLLLLATDLFDRWFSGQAGSVLTNLQAEVMPTGVESNQATQEVFIRQRDEVGLSDLD